MTASPDEQTNGALPLEDVRKAFGRGDEQTEPELDELLNGLTAEIVVATANGKVISGSMKARDKAKVAVVAWSRQQTAQVLKKMLKKQENHFNPKSGGYTECVSVWVIHDELDAIAALRVGLNRSSIATPTNSEEA